MLRHAGTFIYRHRDFRAAGAVWNWEPVSAILLGFSEGGGEAIDGDGARAATGACTRPWTAAAVRDRTPAAVRDGCCCPGQRLVLLATVVLLAECVR